MSTAWTRSGASLLSPAIWCGAAGIDVTDPRGGFISIEGGEGAGKSTQVGLLVSALDRAGIAVKATREPGGSPGAEAIRRLLLEGEGERWDAISEALLLVAARRDHVAGVIAPALAEGVWVVSDRFADSMMAYQGYGKGLGLQDLAALHRFALGDFAPDLTVILDLPVETGLARAAARSPADRFERLDREFHEKLRQGFRQIAADSPARCILIDAAGDPQTVHRAVVAAVEQRLGLSFG
jgi:dTMP kinase